MIPDFFSLVNAAAVCAILASISGLEPSWWQVTNEQLEEDTNEQLEEVTNEQLDQNDEDTALVFGKHIVTLMSR